MYVKEFLDGNINVKIVFFCEYSNEYGLQWRGLLMYYYEVFGDNCQKFLFVLNDQIYYVSVLCLGIKRSLFIFCYGFLRFVMSFNDLLKCRMKLVEEFY